MFKLLAALCIVVICAGALWLPDLRFNSILVSSALAQARQLRGIEAQARDYNTARIDAIVDRYDRVESAVAKMDTRISAMEQRVAVMDARVETMFEFGRWVLAAAGLYIIQSVMSLGVWAIGKKQKETSANTNT